MMDKHILQQFINGNGEYFVGHRFIDNHGRCSNTWETILLSPSVSREYCVDDIGKLPYDDVVKFAEEDLMTIIHLGNNYAPFQYGIRRKDFVQLERVTCKPMDLIVKCYQDDISDYGAVMEAMKALTEDAQKGAPDES